MGNIPICCANPTAGGAGDFNCHLTLEWWGVAAQVRESRGSLVTEKEGKNATHLDGAARGRVGGAGAHWWCSLVAFVGGAVFIGAIFVGGVGELVSWHAVVSLVGQKGKTKGWATYLVMSNIGVVREGWWRGVRWWWCEGKLV